MYDGQKLEKCMYMQIQEDIWNERGYIGYN